MKKTLAVLALAVIALFVPGVSRAQSAQLTWVNAGNTTRSNAQDCLAITQVNSQLSSGYYFCPNQANSFSDPNYYNIGSLYVPSEPGFNGDGIYESMQISWSLAYNVTYLPNGKVDKYDKAGSFEYPGFMTATTVQHYQNVWGIYRGRPSLLYVNTLGGQGTVTASN